MGWLRLDDAFGTHPKIAGLSDRTFRAHVVAMLYAAQHLTDGVVPAAVSPRKPVCDELVRHDLWSPIEGGWLIHDYLEYNPSRAEVLAEREAAKARRSPARKPNVGETSGDVRLPRPHPTPPPEGKKPRERNPLHDTLAEIEGSNPHELTASRARTIGVALAEIRKASPDVTPEEIQRRAAIYREVLPPGTTLTAPALATHWARCGKMPMKRQGTDHPLDRMARDLREVSHGDQRNGASPQSEAPRELPRMAR